MNRSVKFYLACVLTLAATAGVRMLMPATAVASPAPVPGLYWEQSTPTLDGSGTVARLRDTKEGVVCWVTVTKSYEYSAMIGHSPAITCLRDKP